MSSRASLNPMYRPVSHRALVASAGVQPRFFALKPLVALMASWFYATSFIAYANPTGAVAVVGQATLSPQGTQLTVTTQNGTQLNHSAIDWNSFSIPVGNRTYFQQPNAGSTVINRVVTNTPSQLFGSLGSNGHLVLVNHSGITVGNGAVVDTAGFTASSLRMSDADVLTGRLRFGDGNPALGNVSVSGNILARSGDVLLLGASVDTGQAALIQAPNGSTLLAAGQQIDITGRGLEGIRLQVQAPADQVVNLGTLQGDAVGLFASTLRHSGSITAHQVSQEGGKVVLRASREASVEGRAQIVASGTRGGSIDVLGEQVRVTDQALLDASGQNAGGSIRVGGDYQGKNAEVPNAKTAYLGAQAQLQADAVTTGNGGRVIVWSDEATQAYGSLSARGGAQGGDGGLIEVSGKQQLTYRAQADTRAPRGNTGTLLLDPMAIFLLAGPGTDNTISGISTLFGNNIVSNLSSSNVILQTGAGGSGNITFSAGNHDYSAATAGNSLTLLAYADNLASTGNIILSNGSHVFMKPGANLTMVAGWDGVSAATPNVSTALTSGSGGIGLTGDASIAAPGGAVTLLAGKDGISNNAGSGTVTAATLRLKSEGNVVLTGPNQVGSVAGTVTNGGFAYKNAAAGGLTIGLFGEPNGVSASGAIDLQSDAGPLSINSPINTPSSLKLKTSNGNISQTANIVVGGSSIVDAGSGNVTLMNAGNDFNDILLTAGNVSVKDVNALHVAGLSGSASNLDVLFEAGGTLSTVAGTWNVGTGSLSMISGGALSTVGAVTGGNVVLSALGDLNINDSVVASGNLDLFSGGLLKRSSGALSGKNITLSANRMDLQGSAAITAGMSPTDTLWLKPKSNGTLMDVGSSSDVAVNTLELSSAELALLGGYTLRLGAETAGNLNFSAPHSFMTGFSVVSLESGGTITQASTAAISANQLSVKAKGNVALDTAANSAGTLAGFINGLGSEYFHFRSSGSLSIGTVNGLPGIGIGAFPNYVAGTAASVIELQAVGNISQTTGSGLGAAAVWASSSAGSVDLTAAANPTGILAGSASTGFAYRSANPIALMNVNGHSGVATSSGDILLGGSEFSNSLTTPFSISGGGRWLVYTNSPATVNKGGLTSNFRHYNATHASYPTPTEFGNGFIYASAPGTLNVNTTLVSGVASQTYGSTPSAVLGYTIGNAASADNEDLAAITGTPVFTPTLSPTTAVGNYTVNFSTGLSSAAGYSFAAGSGLAYAVNPALINLTGSRVYDGTVNVGASFFTLGGLMNGETLALSGVGTLADKQAGNNKPVTLGSLALGNGSGQASNYQLNNTAAGAIANITQASIASVGGISAANKTYDGAVSAVLDTSAAGFNGKIGSDLLTVLSASGAFSDKNAGSNKTVNISGIVLGGADAGNYLLSNTTASAQANIARASISSVAGITAADKTYDGSTSAVLDASAAGFNGKVSGDTLTVATASGAFGNKNAGANKTVNISGISLGGADAGNYLLSNTSASAQANITRADISSVGGITAADKTYDGNLSAVLDTSAAGFNGKVSADKLTVATANGAFSDKDAGSNKTVNITGISLGGADAGNYLLKSTTASASASILPASIANVELDTKANLSGSTVVSFRADFDGLLAKLERQDEPPAFLAARSRSGESNSDKTQRRKDRSSVVVEGALCSR